MVVVFLIKFCSKSKIQCLIDIPLKIVFTAFTRVQEQLEPEQWVLLIKLQLDHFGGTLSHPQYLFWK